MRNPMLLASGACALWLSANGASAQASSQTPEKNTEIESVTVVGHAVGELGLTRITSSGSRLGLTAMETPATVEVLDDQVMRARGYEKLSEVVQSFPGIVTGEQATAPSAFSMRGFAGSQITVLRDGLWIGPSTMVMRPQNTFNLSRVEILRGPSSVLNGVGAVAGAVNAITKSAQPDVTDEINLLASYGSFGAHHLGLGAKGELGDGLWYSGTLSDYGADGYVKDTNQESTNYTLSLLWEITSAIKLKISGDHLRDDVGSYLGTPLVPVSAARKPLTDVVTSDRGETLDEAMRFKNYNVEDARAESEQDFYRADLYWDLDDDTSLEYNLYQFNAERSWKNAEGYIYCTQKIGVCTEVGSIQRYYGYFLLDHEQNLLGNRVALKHQGGLGALANKVVLGAEKVSLDFTRTRGFRRQVPVQPGDAVDPFNPLRGFYGPEELRGTSPTDIVTRAVFAEDLLQVTPALSLVMAVRYDELQLNRKNFNAAGQAETNGFARGYDWLSWRLGSVYTFTPDLVGYWQYSDAKDPIGSNIFLVNANQNFDLTDAVQWEGGIKSVWLDGRGEFTLAYFDIARDDILERFAVDSVTNIGGRDASGIEISISAQPGSNWRLGLNGAYTEASFKRSTNMVAFAGNRPPNVPEWTANAWLSYDKLASLPLEVGVAAHYVGNRYGDNQNSVLLKNYALVDVFAAWKIRNYRLSAKINNLFDEIYAPWSEVSYLHQDAPDYLFANQLILGAPRSVRLSLEATF